MTMNRRAARQTSTLTMLVGLVLLVCALNGGCEARRMYMSQRHDTVKEVTPSEPMDLGGWRPVIDNRFDRPQLPEGYDPMSPLPSPSGPGDQTADLVPPPRGSNNKPIKKNKPTRKPNVKGQEASETRVTPPTYILPDGQPRPTMRFPDEKRRNPIRRQRPGHPHPHVHYHHVRQSPYSVAESNQQIRFRPSPQAPAAYENPYPGWLLQQQNDEQQQQQSQQQGFYNGESSAGIINLQGQYTPDGQIQLALAQQQPELAQQQFQRQQQQQSEITQQQYQQQQPHHSGFLPGTSQVFGNPNLFNLQAEHKDGTHENLFLSPSATEPSVHENEVPQGPPVFLGHTTRGRPVRPTYDPSDLTKYQIPESNYQHHENSEHRPRRPRPPTHIQAQLENNNRRPIVNENEGQLRITEVRPSQKPSLEDDPTNFRPRHPRPPSTEPPSWSHPVQDADHSVRLRRPRPTQQTQFQSQDSNSQDVPAPRRPRPPPQDQNGENENQERPRVRRPRPPVQEQAWKQPMDAPEEEQVIPTQQAQFETQVRPQRPRQPPPVLEEIEDDVDRPVFTLRPRRPQPAVQEEEQQPEEVQRVRRPRPPVEEEIQSESVIKNNEEPSTQEDVDETVNVRPRRPRPPEGEERPDRPRTRRPRPPQERRRRPTTPRPAEAEEEAVPEQPVVRRRRPQRPVEESDDTERKPQRRPNRPWNQRAQQQQQHDETTEPMLPAVELMPESEIKFIPTIPDEPALDENVPEESLVEDTYPSFLPTNYDNFPEYPTVETVPETTQSPPTTAQSILVPSIPPKRRKPLYKFEEPETPDFVEATENYPPQFRVTTEAATTLPPPTTTLPPTTTFSVINSRLRARLNATRQRYGGANRLTALTSKRINKVEDTTTEAPSVPSAPEENSSRIRQKTRESSRFRLGTTSTTTEEPAVERTTFKPTASRFPRPGNRYYSRYRAGSEEPTETTTQQDSIRRSNVNIFTNKERRKFPLRSRHDDEGVTETTPKESTTASFSISEVTTTNQPEFAEITTITPTENEIVYNSNDDEDKTEIPTTYASELEPESTTIPADFSPAKRVTDLTSSATAFKPLSFFSAVPADGKHASQLSSRFTMATEDPILPLEAFFPTFTSKPRQQDDYK